MNARQILALEAALASVPSLAGLEFSFPLTQRLRAGLTYAAAPRLCYLRPPLSMATRIYAHRYYAHPPLPSAYALG